MKITKDKKYFTYWENRFSFFKEISESININADIVFLTDKFLEYQKDLFNEFMSEISEELSNSQDINLKQFKYKLEDMLQQMNSKLITFSEKIHNVEKFDIRWTVQIFFKETYMSSMVWDVSTVIYRNNKVNYVVDNDLQWVEWIDVFSEFIEWELEDNDKVLTVWTKISDVLEEDELQEAIDVENEWTQQILENISKILKSRISDEHINFISFFDIQFDTLIKQEDIKDRLQKNVKYLKNFKEFLINYKYPISIAVGFLVVLYLLIALISAFIQWDRGDVVSTPDWEVVIDFTIDDLRKDIDLFRRIPVHSDQKLQKYNEILQKLEMLEQTGRWAHNIEELKQILDQEYLKWFNIVPVNNIYWDYVYEFEEDEFDALWQPVSVEYSDWINIWGTQGAILRAINSEARWTVLNFDLPVDIHGCAGNLLDNGLYCFAESWQIVNVTRNGINTVSTQAWEFEENITWIWTYWSSNFYTIFFDEERFEQWEFISRYRNQPWDQNSFGSPDTYDVNESFFEQNEEVFASWFTNISIDGSFLTWSPKENSIVQFHRTWQTNTLDARIIPLTWGPEVISDHGEDVDVLSYEWSRLVYTMDKDNNIFTVYRSAPYKTNTAHIMNYDLQYYFSLRFDKGDEIISAYVDDGEAPILYVLTDEWVARYNLSTIGSSFEN